MIRAGALIFVISLCTASALACDCATFRDSELDFKGRLVALTFPGPPNYESIASGDATETHWYLQLPKPECWSEFDHQLFYQLLLSAEDFDKYRKLLGSEVQVRGTLQEATTGHHHTPLVMTVKSLTKLEANPK
jgi:hypothetical protein